MHIIWPNYQPPANDISVTQRQVEDVKKFLEDPDAYAAANPVAAAPAAGGGGGGAATKEEKKAQGGGAFIWWLTSLRWGVKNSWFQRDQRLRKWEESDVSQRWRIIHFYQRMDGLEHFGTTNHQNWRASHLVSICINDNFWMLDYFWLLSIRKEIQIQTLKILLESFGHAVSVRMFNRNPPKTNKHPSTVGTPSRNPTSGGRGGGRRGGGHGVWPLRLSRRFFFPTVKCCFLTQKTAICLWENY